MAYNSDRQPTKFKNTPFGKQATIWLTEDDTKKGSKMYVGYIKFRNKTVKLTSFGNSGTNSKGKKVKAIDVVVYTPSKNEGEEL